jgi:hypothetical protein
VQPRVPTPGAVAYHQLPLSGSCIWCLGLLLSDAPCAPTTACRRVASAPLPIAVLCCILRRHSGFVGWNETLAGAVPRSLAWPSAAGERAGKLRMVRTTYTALLSACHAAGRASQLRDARGLFFGVLVAGSGGLAGLDWCRHLLAALPGAWPPNCSLLLRAVVVTKPANVRRPFQGRAPNMHRAQHRGATALQHGGASRSRRPKPGSLEQAGTNLQGRGRCSGGAAQPVITPPAACWPGSRHPLG